MFPQDVCFTSFPDYEKGIYNDEEGEMCMTSTISVSSDWCRILGIEEQRSDLFGPLKGILHNILLLQKYEKMKVD